MTLEIIKLFKKLKYCFQTALVLVYFNLTKHSMFETNTSGKVLRAIFLQLIKKTGQ